MRNYLLNIFDIVKHAIPHFLQKGGVAGYWANPSGLFWITSSGLNWGQQILERHLSYIKALLSPLQRLCDEFATMAQDAIYRLTITGQVIYLEHYLNDKLDPVRRRIFISDGDLVLPNYIYFKNEEEEPLEIYNKDYNDFQEEEDHLMIYSRADYEVNSVLFFINVPDDILNDSVKILIKAFVTPYKRAGTKFIIKSPLEKIEFDNQIKKTE